MGKLEEKENKQEVVEKCKHEFMMYDWEQYSAGGGQRYGFVLGRVICKFCLIKKEV